MLQLDAKAVYEQTFLSCMVEALETMAFIMPEPVEEPPSDDFTGLCTVHVVFKGAISGRLTLATTRQFTISLAANVLGCEPDDPEALKRAEDAFKELSNVVAGLTLRRLGAHVELAVPRYDGADRPYIHPVANQTCLLSLSADGQPLTGLLELDAIAHV